MQKIETYISNDAPAVKGGLWLRPMEGGFVLYALYGGKWQPLKLADDKGTEDEKDDAIQNLVGSVQDKKTANTINGAKAYAKSAAKTVLGSVRDTSADMTLYGLKAYIDEKLSIKGD